MVKRWIFRIVFSLCAILFLAYLGDYLVITLAIHRGRSAYGSVQVNQYLAVPLKGGKTEFDFQGTQATTCSNSLFPQMGFQPCWWLRRHTEKREDI